MPGKLSFLRCRHPAQIWRAIRSLQVRGAPAIGAAAALGVYLGIHKSRAKNARALKKQVQKLSSYFAGARPTAVNLIWALRRMTRCAQSVNADSPDELKRSLLREALSIIKEDKTACRKMAQAAQPLIKHQAAILTYCNTGILATIDYGTALGALYRARSLGKKIKIYACETRPLLQGARLTCWELNKQGMDVTLICDNMAGDLMRQKKIDAVFIGADRIARNGDTANKIGSYTMAVLARYHRIPFYVVAPRSSFDRACAGGSAVPIEQRNPEEVRALFFKKPAAPEGVRIHNPAFDIVPHELITAIITESGIISSPGVKSILRQFRHENHNPNR